MSQAVGGGGGESGQAGGGRRGFLEFLLGTSFFGLAVSLLYPAWRFVFPPRGTRVAEEALNVGKAEDFPNNSGKLFLFGGEPMMVLRTPSGELRAFFATCTHLACTVEYRSDLQQMFCACHGGRFDLTGKNVAGPPPRPLTALSVSERDGDILVSRQA
jgi:Rieske Fe-S protein